MPYQLLSVQQTAMILGVSKQVVYQLISSGQLRGRKIGERLWRVAEQDLALYLENAGFILCNSPEETITEGGHNERI